MDYYHYLFNGNYYTITIVLYVLIILVLSYIWIIFFQFTDHSLHKRGLDIRG